MTLTVKISKFEKTKVACISYLGKQGNNCGVQSFFFLMTNFKMTNLIFFFTFMKSTLSQLKLLC